MECFPVLILKILKVSDKNLYCKIVLLVAENKVEPVKLVFGQKERRKGNILFAQDEF
jgi:hypothetical protein